MPTGLTALAKALAPHGVLRAGINLSNILLVSSRGPSGEPRGVAPDMARALAASLSLPLELVPYNNPGLLADAAPRDEWDVGLIGAEPERARTIAFTAPYVEIEATYLVPAGSPLQSIAEVDQPGRRIAVSARSAYDLWLSANLKHAALERTDEPGLDRSLALFRSGGHDALAGLRPWLRSTAAAALAGSRVLDGQFTAVQQSIGTPRHRADGGVGLFLERFIEEAKASGQVQTLLETHGVADKLTVAA
ncbi:hypothetical protein AB1Y20_002623 [Prymnesium parvum]|uniref:Solute-binding protein family 3/N-terminal domain-containing protein n=1 Tax=Prymnesium parvum TaxID=97485 RepID=A0AB34JAX4_PRYPA